MILFASCDKVENAYYPDPQECYDDLYPDGDSTHYANNAMPTFTENTNTDRNVLIEDFTGHKCISCPGAAIIAENIVDANPGRVFICANHTGSFGLENFQVVDVVNGYLHDFTCEEGLAIGLYFGQEWPGTSFQGNPSGTVNRYGDGNGDPITDDGNWESRTTTMLSANDLKVNIQSAKNYYSSTRGLFVHTEIDVLDPALTNELRIVVQLIEDSIIKPQSMPDVLDIYDGTVDGKDELYVHRDILRACIDGKAFGQKLDDAHLDANGKYYFDYCYELPAEYNASNMHLLIYVRDADTEEIYQVIKQYID
jgi:hypothetical protein